MDRSGILNLIEDCINWKRFALFSLVNPKLSMQVKLPEIKHFSF